MATLNVALKIKCKHNRKARKTCKVLMRLPGRPLIRTQETNLILIISSSATQIAVSSLEKYRDHAISLEMILSQHITARYIGNFSL